MTDVSIIIPVYNVGPYIKQCIESVIAQSCECTIECIIVDDRGTDNSMSIAESIVTAYSGPVKFRIIQREKNGGLSAARNSGINIANGKYLFFLDSDDTIADHCIQSLWNCVKKYPDVEIVFGKTICVPDKSARKNYFDTLQKYGQIYCNDLASIRNVILKFPEVACNKLIKREWLLQNNLLFREGILHEDLDWQLRSYHCTHSYACELNESPTYLYLIRGGSITAERLSPKHVWSTNVIYSDFAKNTKLWSPEIIHHLCYELLKYKGLIFADKDGKTAKSYYNTLLKSILNNSSLPINYRLVMLYFKLPKVFISGRLVDKLISVLIKESGLGK